MTLNHTTSFLRTIVGGMFALADVTAAAAASLSPAVSLAMSSTLVETVSINYDDFNDSFLTCGTCLCMYDGEEHNPKLLPCSHTVCRSCLERIVEASRDNTQVRCPICRENIPMPRGGVASFPPSFIVNQLLDLMARQRRDIIPKCSQHPNQELMFCETCDTVFCMLCTGGSHNGRGASAAHTVIPFSIAIKRMSEILLYKASLCMRNLNKAAEVVSGEMCHVDAAADACADAVNKHFEEVINAVEQRRLQVMAAVQKVKEQKKQVLKEQLDIIEAEKAKVQHDCQGLQSQVEVRNITKRISDLNEKLDISTTLSEPRENSFMKFEVGHNSAFMDVLTALEGFGRVRISKTFPALCNAQLEKSVVHLKTTVKVATVDYHGNPRLSGGDPLVVDLRSENGERLTLDEVVDHDNGHYTVTFTPRFAGKHALAVSIFERPIRDSPFTIDVSEHNNPVLKVGSRGSGVNQFIQPVAACIDSASQQLYVLDTGNSRIKVLDAATGAYIRDSGSAGLENRSGTGMTLVPSAGAGTTSEEGAQEQQELLVVNWRSKYVTQLDAVTGDVVHKFSCAEFQEPVSLTVNRHGEIIVADNGLGKLLVFDSHRALIRRIGCKGREPGQFRLITAVYVPPGGEDHVIVTDTQRMQLFSRDGTFLREFPAASSAAGGAKGQYGGGIVLDAHGNLLATRQEKGRSVVHVMDAASGDVKFVIDSFDDKLKRPSGLAVTSDGHVYVVDLGNDCVKKYRYM